MSDDTQKDDTQKAQEELDAMRTKLDELKVKGSLLKMELRDKKDEAIDGIESAYAVAKAKFEELKATGETEAGKLGSGFSAAWSAFKEAYDNATESTDE